jgi:WD40 repeat protein
MSSCRILALLAIAILLIGVLDAAPVTTPTTEKVAETPRVDLYGDPLPPGALARIGTVRLRHGDSVTTVIFSPDGKTLASPGYDAVRLWDVASGRQLRHLYSDPPFYRGAFAPDGKTLWLQRYQGEIFAWDLTAAKPRLTPAPFASKKSEFIALSPDGKTLAAGAGNDVVLWDPVTGKEKTRLAGHRYPVRQAAFSADGKRLASAQILDLILWEPATDRKILHVKSPVDDRGVPVERLEHFALSADGSILAAMVVDYPERKPRQRVRVWETATGKERWSLLSEAVAPRDLAFSPDGKTLALVGQHSLCFWDASTGKVRREYTYRSTQFSAVVFSPDGRTLAAAMTHGVGLWDVTTGREICPIPEHRLGVGAIQFARDGRTLITQDQGWGGFRDDIDGMPRFWDAVTGRRLLSEDDRQLSAGILSPDGKILASLGGDAGGIVLWDTKTGKRRHHVGPGDKVEHYWLAPDGKHLLVLTMTETPSGARKSAMRLWETATGKEINLFGDDTGGSWPAGFSPDGNRVVVVFNDCVIVWDIGTRRRLHTFKIDPENRVFSFAFSLDGKLLTFAEWGGRIRLCRIDSGKELPSLLNEQTKEKLPRSGIATALTPDGRTVFTTDMDRNVFGWERATGGLRLGWRAHESRVIAVCVSLDGKMLATTGDGTALTWDVAALAGARDGLTPKELSGRWADLSSDDAARAYRAIWALARNAEQSVPLIDERLPAALKTEMRRVENAVTALAGDDLEDRKNAVHELEPMRFFAEAALQQALAAKPGAAARDQIEALLEQVDRPLTSPACLRIWRALEVLEHAGTPKARALLLKLAKEAKDSRIKQEAKAILARLS